jgi:hypothetical protein
MSTTPSSLHDYLIISRGQWAEDATPERIQDAIDRFYVWYERLLAEGVIGAGSRLAREGKLVTSQRVIDGPFAEAKEVVGGYWFIRAASLDEAATIVAQNPCIACGLAMEVRPLEADRARADKLAAETPPEREQQLSPR